jgi:spoIIIJ-associated protein
MESYEFQGKNTEDAVETARRELGLPPDRMEIEILEPGSAGIFGLVGGRKAKIRVRIKEELIEEPVKEETPPGTSGQPSAQETTEGAELARSSLEKILSLIPVEGVQVKSEQADGTIRLTIAGDSSGLLIGRRGKTLDALQFIVNRIVNKVFEERLQVIVDSENYRQRHQDSIVDMAMKLCDKAKKSKKPVSTTPLNPYDRRLIHIALRDDGEVETKSRGEGTMKKIVIIPRKSSSGQPRRTRPQEDF